MDFIWVQILALSELHSPSLLFPPIKGGKDLPSPLRERVRLKIPPKAGVRVIFEMNEVDNLTDALL
jgi:hypothetical protein